MSTYELDDDLVRESLTQSSKSHAARDLVFSALERQLPIPAPDLPGAIVKAVGGAAGREDEANYYLRWTGDERTHSPWIEYGNHEKPWRTDEIGRITAVISQGYDLPLLS